MLMNKFVPVSMTPYPDEGERLGIEWLRQKKRMKESSLDWAVAARGVLHVFRLSPFKYYTRRAGVDKRSPLMVN